MAFESPVGAHMSKFPAWVSDPTPAPSSFSRPTSADDKFMTQLAYTEAEEVGQNPGYGFLQPTSKYPDAGHDGSVHTSHRDYASSTPIDVPRPKADREEQWAIDNGLWRNETSHDRMYEDIQVEEFWQDRRPSIKFSPEVTLDSGDRHNLEEPLPRLALDSKPIDRLALKEQERYPHRSDALYRTHSEADIREYDAVTGERLDHLPSVFDAREPRSPTSPYQLDGAIPTPTRQAELHPLHIEEATSLTSELTISPIIEEAQTPPENMEILTSPISAFPPFALPTSYEDSSAWPKPRRRTSSRTNPFTIERTSSMHSSRRPTTRRSTSSPMSPASTFLSRFASRDSPPLEPDSAGQVVGEYVLGKEVGFGGFSTVKEAFTIEGGQKTTRAAKIVRKQLSGRNEDENDRLQAEFEHEVQIWRCLGHRNILPLIEVYDTSFATFCFTKLNTGGTLFDKIRSNRSGLDAGLAKRYAYQLASAVRYLHEDVHVVHRDIKLENCLIDTSDPSTAAEGGNLLLCDFGLAEFTANDLRSNSPDPYSALIDRPPHPSTPSDAATSIAGSLQYASPELILSPAGFLSPVVDIWAFGVVIYAMLVGDLPFQHVFQPRVQMMILAGEWDIAKLEGAKAARGAEDEVLEFVCGCLDMRSEARWSVGEVLKSRWLRGMQEMLEEREGGFKL